MTSSLSLRLDKVSVMFLKATTGSGSSEFGLSSRCWMEAILGEILSRSPLAGTSTSATSLSVDEEDDPRLFVVVDVVMDEDMR